MNADSLNPYASPTIPVEDRNPDQPPFTFDEARQKLRIPAYGLGAAALACVVAILISVPLIFLDKSSAPPFTLFGDFVSRLILAVLQTTLLGGLAWIYLRGCIAMRQLRGYATARWAAVLGVATMGGVCGIALPFSIWAFALLCDERVRGAFRPEPIRWEFASLAGK